MISGKTCFDKNNNILVFADFGVVIQRPIGNNFNADIGII